MLPRTLAPPLLVLIVASLATPAAADPVPIPPLPPADLRAAHDAGTGAVVLSWSAAPGDVDAYAVHRNGALLGTTGADELGFTDTAPVAAAAYTVTALGPGGESPPSAPVAVVRVPEPASSWPATLDTGLPANLEGSLLGGRMCEPIIVGGIPPSAHVNWACIDLPSLEG